MIALALVASVALADVGPRPPPCTVPAECVTCVTSLSSQDAGTACQDGAADAGLTVSSCSDRIGATVSNYYCPKGKDATRGCGCDAAPMAAAWAGAAWVLRGRRRS